MPDFEFEFNQQDKELMVSQNSATFGGTDYIRLTIYPQEAINNIVTLPTTNEQAIFYSSLNEEEFNINISPFSVGLDEFNTYSIGGNINGGKGGDFKIYRNVGDDSIYIKPNEIFNEFELPQGNYRIQIDFLNQVETTLPFIIKQISTSRKEVRLKILNENIVNNSNIITNLTNEFNNFEEPFLSELDEQGNQIPNPNYKYQFKHVLNIGTGDHIPIMNYQFDRVTDGRENQSLILKLYDVLPSNVGNLSMVTIEREVLTTQIQDIFYFSDVEPLFFGDGLQTDFSYNDINSDNNDIGFQSLDELAISASLGDIEIESLISQSEYGYPNLNTDFNEFENHTFFGSAKKKLENFKTKVETIQSYYSEISTSLSISSSIDYGDSPYIIQTRKSFFDKINEEFKNFTPYERFLYFDAQTDSTASAPSLKNYADTIPVKDGVQNDYVGELNQHNGFNVVYKHSSQNAGAGSGKYIDLFTDKYKVENKPFFNYSGSIYLSFLMQADSGSSLTWENRNKQHSPPLPKDTLYQNSISNPTRTGSAYQRYVFQASMSYFIPNTANNDMADLSGSNFNAGSDKITILSGNVKTGSYPIKDTTGVYPTTVVTQSGVPFSGSIMPAGELFRVYFVNSSTSSLQGYWDIDDVTSGSALSLANVVNDAGPTTGDATTVSHVTASSGVEVHGRQYGSSYFMISESQDTNTGVHFDTTDFNFSKDDNFSLSIWAKRFHPNTPSADAGGVGSRKQGIFTRGLVSDMYGIDYISNTNKIRAGVQPGGAATRQVVEMEMGDDLLNWHHLVMTYESGSDTGIKLYIDGVLTGSVTSVTDGDGDTMGDFSSSAITDTAEKLTIGGDDVFDASATVYNGFLQYPRVYDRAITSDEVQQLYLTPDGLTETKITDVKVTLKDPSDVLPFDNLFHTSSTEWTNWYNDMLTKAETFDTDNIHSFENNLPLYIQNSSDYQDMKDFLNLQGEQYDLIRNHIDSMGTIHKRGYKKTNSPPNNTLPMLLSNMGWEAINPFSGSLSDTLGSYLTGVTSIDDIKNNTWRKTLNNLLYIYKSKGTKNSVRALLNTYGYPPDVLQFQEFGGSSINNKYNEGLDDIFDGFGDTPSDDDNIDLNLDLTTGSFSFKSDKLKLYRYNFNAKTDRVLNLDWWMDSANINSFEFIYKHKQTTQTQTILESSGSNTQSLWDLRLVPSSDGLSSSFEFRLNNSLTGSLPIATNAVSMSTSYSNISDGQLWNVMLQRMTSSNSTNITNEYRLHAALQEGKKIQTYNYVTMSISGGISIDSNNIANKNWMSSGSRNELSSSNLFVGEVFSGSLSQIKGWSTALSTSKFRQHVLNKFSNVGNTINSHKDELIYNFKLNENYTTASVSSSGQNLTIVDSAPTTTYSDYSFTKSGDLFTSSLVYGFDYVEVNKFTFLDNSSKEDDNNILINPDYSVLGNLNPIKPSKDLIGKKPFKPSPKLELYRAPQSFVDDFILDNISGFNLETLYAEPINYYSQSYSELDTFRINFFDAHPIEVNVNQFIRAHENMFNDSIVEGLKQIIPARSTFSDRNSKAGVEIKPTILEKQKYENEEQSVETNPNTATGSILFIENTEYKQSSFISTFESIKTGSISVIAPETIMSRSRFELPYSASIGRGYIPYGLAASDTSSLKPSTTGSSLVLPQSASISPLPSLSNSAYEASKNGTIDYGLIANESYKSVHKNWGRTDDDVQHINFAAPKGSDGTFNTYDIEKRFIFHSIGDSEYYSASMGNASNFSDDSRFYNRLMIDEDFHSDTTYESYIYGNPGPQTGRMMGKTRFFSSSADGGVLTLPRNHVTNFSNPFKEQMIEGTQNTNPGFLNVQYEDYSTASFYRVKVTGGQNQIRVQSGNPGIGSDDKIIYDDNSEGGTL